MLADTAAIHAFGSTSTGLAADLTAVAGRLAAVPGEAAGPALGPVGARYLAALSQATTRASRAVAELGESMAAAGSTAHGSAAGYADAERRAAGSLGA